MSKKPFSVRYPASRHSQLRQIAKDRGCNYGDALEFCIEIYDKEPHPRAPETFELYKGIKVSIASEPHVQDRVRYYADMYNVTQGTIVYNAIGIAWGVVNP